MRIEEVLARFPKQRPELPAAYRAIYERHYRENREGATRATSIASKLESWLHAQVAADVASRPNRTSTLELGAGTLNQIAYENPLGAYDIVEPFAGLYAGSALLARVRHRYDSIHQVDAGPYDRVTAVATFEHVCDLPQVIARAGLLLKPDGALRAAIPSEGTVLWNLAWRYGTGPEFRRRHGLDYGVLMRHEHVNTAAEIEALLRHFFGRVEIRVFGLARGLSLYQAFVCRQPRRSLCQTFLAPAGERGIRPPNG